MIALLQSAELPPERQAEALAYLEANLPEAEVGLLLEWPGQWFNNRWFEEEAVTPEEAAEHLLERCGRELAG